MWPRGTRDTVAGEVHRRVWCLWTVEVVGTGTRVTHKRYVNTLKILFEDNGSNLISGTLLSLVQKIPTPRPQASKLYREGPDVPPLTYFSRTTHLCLLGTPEKYFFVFIRGTSSTTSTVTTLTLVGRSVVGRGWLSPCVRDGGRGVEE